MVKRQIAKHTAANISQCTTRFPLGRYPGQLCKSRHRQSGRTNNSRPCVGDVITPPQTLHLANGDLKNIGMLCTDAYGGSTAYANQRMKPGVLVIGQNVDQHADQMDWQCKTHSHTSIMKEHFAYGLPQTHTCAAYFSRSKLESPMRNKDHSPQSYGETHAQLSMHACARQLHVALAGAGGDRGTSNAIGPHGGHLVATATCILVDAHHNELQQIVLHGGRSLQ